MYESVIIARYSPIATGATLYKVNIGGDKRELIWQADVEQLNVGHSQYYNDLYLSRFKDKIILEGREASGSYLQIFNNQNGKLLYISIRPDSLFLPNSEVVK
jgi:hypothetical protein